MSRKQFLENELARIQRELDIVNDNGRAEAMIQINGLVTQLDLLIQEAKKIAEKYDIQFYYHNGYGEFIVDPEVSWESSNC